MPPAKTLQHKTVYQLKVSLMGSTPLVWRRAQVVADTRLSKLHKILQVVMGWDNSHLYEFIIDKVSYGEPHPDYGVKMKDASKTTVVQVASAPGTNFTYIYDFGDGWRHIILVEKILQAEPDVKYPLCIDGAMACPPEDCGGIGGYANFLDAVNDPAHEEHESMLEWIGGGFDPKAFDRDRVNTTLKRMK